MLSLRKPFLTRLQRWLDYQASWGQEVTYIPIHPDDWEKHGKGMKYQYKDIPFHALHGIR